MTIELTESQRDEIARASEPLVRVVDPLSDAAYVLVPAEEFEALRETWEEERVRRAVRGVAMKNAVARALSDDEP